MNFYQLRKEIHLLRTIVGARAMLGECKNGEYIKKTGFPKGNEEADPEIVKLLDQEKFKVIFLEMIFFFSRIIEKQQGHYIYFIFDNNCFICEFFFPNSTANSLHRPTSIISHSAISVVGNV